MPSFSPLATAVLGGVLVVVGLVLLDRLARWAERRGWIDRQRRNEASDAESGSGESSNDGGATPEEPATKR